jgi:chromosome segregation ATPase
MERLEDEVTDIKPKEISKKFNEIKESMEKDRLEVEKLQKKSEGTNEKVNEIYEMIKSIGGVENLINLNNDIQTKLKDINEAIKYIQRIGAKTEKIFIDLSKGMEDLVLLKAKQEDFDESIKNALTSIDSLNVKLKDYVSKSDMEDIKGEIVMVKKQMDEIKKVLPIAELKLPENMIKLRKDKEDIEMFLDSLESQHIEGKINKAEYEELKKINVKKLNDVESKLEKEWKDIDRVMKPSEEEGETSEDVQGGIVKKKKARRSKTSKKKAKKERDRKKKILKDLKING